MSKDTKSIASRLLEMEAEVLKEEASLGLTDAFGSASDLPEMSPKFYEVIRALISKPILVEPTVRWIRLKQAQLAAAELGVLYSPEELEELKARLAEEEKGK